MSHPSIARLFSLISDLSSAGTDSGKIRAIKSNWVKVRERMSLTPSCIRVSPKARFEKALADIVAGSRKAPRRGPLAQAARKAVRAAQYRRMIAEQYPYRVSRSSWAGGDHHVSVSIVEGANEGGGKGWSDRVWSHNGKWSGTSSRASIWVNANVPAKLLIVGGLVTVYAARRAKGVYAAKWLEQGRGFELKVISGWIVRGHHVRGGTMEAAVRHEREARRSAHQQFWAARRAAAIVRLPLDSRWLTFSDSLASGNCEAGTEQAANRIASRLGLSVDELRKGVAVRASVVVQELPDLSIFIHRSLNAAAIAGH